MKTVCVELNDNLVAELAALISHGLFRTEDEAIRFALLAFIENEKPALLERFQREDIAWALEQKKQ